MGRGATVAIVLAPLLAVGACTFGGLDGATGGATDAGAARSPSPEAAVVDSSGFVEAAALAETAAPLVEAGAPSLDAQLDAPAGCDSANVLVGNDVLDGSTEDGTDINVLDTYGFDAVKAGIARCAFLYLEAPLPSTPAVVGVYTQRSDAVSPGSLHATAVFAHPVVGWNAARLDQPVVITQGERLWLGVGAEQGTINDHFHARDCGELTDRSGSEGPAGPADPFPQFPTKYPTTCDVLAYLTP